MKKKQYPIALTIAGSDSGGGAGIQADLKAFSANGAYGMSVITALTAQNTQGVQGIQGVPVEFIEQQLESVLTDIGTDVVKIGMLHSTEVIRTVVEVLKAYRPRHIVLDPVMVATSGDKLLQDEAIETLIQELIPLAHLITPNVPEAEILLGQKIDAYPSINKATRALTRTGARGALLKAGHLTGETLTDVFYDAETDNLLEMPMTRIDTQNTHGTGCTLSSAIAAHLAQGESMEQAVQAGLIYIHQAIKAGADYQLGQGHGPVFHFYNFW